MNNTRRVFKAALFLLFILAGIVVVNSIASLIGFKSEMVLFDVKEGTFTSITVSEESRYTLYIDNFIEDGEDAYDCKVTRISESIDSRFVCTNNETFETVSFNIRIYSDNNHYNFTGMGNVTLIQNNRLAIGRITLPEGIYNIEVTQTGGYYNFYEIRLENSSNFGEIFKIIFGSIIAVGLFIGYVILSIVQASDKSKLSSKYHKKTDESTTHLTDDFDEDDPFAKYD